MPISFLKTKDLIPQSILRIGCAVMIFTLLQQSCLAQGQDQLVNVFRSADLPPVMRFLDGTPVETQEHWQRRREEIARLWCETYIGHFPEETPDLLEVHVASETQRRDGVIVRDVRLEFDTANQTACHLRILLPPIGTKRSDQALPLLLTQPRNYQLAWGEAAVKRGYVVCYYPGVDYNHREQDFPGFENTWKQFKDACPNATWSSSLAIQSWIAGRALDYLLSDRFDRDIHPEQVGIIGHSRYGKQSLYAAAFDSRIKAVVSRSAGSPAAAGYRFTGRDTFMETVMDAPTEWALPSLKTYFGREHELPVESNGLLALIAPRACMLHTAYNDGSDPTFAVERTYLSAKRAYQFLGHTDKLALVYREGNHNPITEEHIAVNLDWFDWNFGRGNIDRSRFSEKLLHRFDWKAWRKQQSNDAMTSPDSESSLFDRVQWMLGEAPAWAKESGSSHPLTILKEEDCGVALWSRDRWKPKGVVRMPVSFGANVHGNLAFPKQHDKPLPVVIWLHPFNYSHGSNEGYGVEGTSIYYQLAQAGYAVLSFDQIGFGDRLLEGASFYDEYPRWSKLGRMVFDVRCAVDFVRGGHGIAEGAMPDMNSDNITLLGYSLGGMLALHAAALDERQLQVATFCGWTPMRSDDDSQLTGGIRRWWEWHGLLPKLGLFHEREKVIPYDFVDLLKSISDRPCLVYSATNDRQVTPSDVVAAVNEAKMRAGGILQFHHVQDVNRFQSDQHKILLEWLARIR